MEKGGGGGGGGGGRQVEPRTVYRCMFLELRRSNTRKL